MLWQPLEHELFLSCFSCKSLENMLSFDEKIRAIKGFTFESIYLYNAFESIYLYVTWTFIKHIILG